MTASGNCLTPLVCAPADEAVGRRAGDYLRRYRKSHAVELGDALIAATAVSHGAMLGLEIAGITP